MMPALIFTQVPSKEEAELIATTLVTQKLAACVHIFPQGQSIYTWNGELQFSSEYHLQIKTLCVQFSPISRVIRSLCSYQVPEILLVKITSGSEEYLHWLSSESSSKTS
ncbi:divalent-cation tolerance protein CutA [Chlamydia gallinacea]|uniref:Divalent cation transporter n=2 Tax=Chlamydia gallinacea TaxID=1457153 RepID=A0A173DYF1_9CHLA|nr:divalent-cation tolerance protein CutA [Chlamydia gallinacea]ANG65926.1 divalent cation transporter [Chlamydia gallinacea 08-1274/3]AQT77837.1 divalent-cation tolerance protein CutA [Chlamydia gallinacea]MBX6680577.1 divalent-cation tolerance protein CutA [Chlamydia gallinacea]